MYLSCWDSAAIASMSSFARWSGLNEFCKKCEQGQRMVRETFEKDISRLLWVDTLQISFPQLLSALFLKHLNISIISALNLNLRVILRTANTPYFCLHLVSLMLPKTMSPIISTFLPGYLIILWIHAGKIWTKGPQTCTLWNECIFLAGTPLELFQCFSFKVC